MDAELKRIKFVPVKRTYDDDGDGQSFAHYRPESGQEHTFDDVFTYKRKSSVQRT
jgi:hypothetical protein